MLLDMRTYTCKTGMLKKHLALYKEKGKAPQVRILGEPVVFMITETGNVNQFVHVWKYENAGDREARRATLWADAEWLAYVAASAELGGLEKQENALMTPADFFPLP